MTVPIAKNESLPLIEVIESLGETEWRKGSASEFVEKEEGIWVLKKQLHVVPMVSFRFRGENPEAINFLRVALDGYKGAVEWVLSEHNREFFSNSNWTIGPKCLFEAFDAAAEEGITPGQYLYKCKPGFSKIAFDDLVVLAEYIKNNSDRYRK